MPRQEEEEQYLDGGICIGGGVQKNFDEDFCLIACMASTTGSSVWYVDNGASCHMTGHKRFFKSLQEGELNLHIELGDDAQYQAKGVGTVSFQRESGKPLSFANILYVSRLTKNLISVLHFGGQGILGEVLRP